MYATLKNRELSLHDGRPSLEQMQEAVGGYIETALRVPTDRKHITVDVYCNEEGLLCGLPINYRRTTDGAYLAGDFVIVGGNDATGEQADLTLEEIGNVFEFLEALDEPILDYEF